MKEEEEQGEDSVVKAVSRWFFPLPGKRHRVLRPDHEDWSTIQAVSPPVTLDAAVSSPP